MNNSITVKVDELIGSLLCISTDDAQKVFEKLKFLLDSGKNIIISFFGVEILISLFLNISIGQLYGFFQEKEIVSRMEVVGLADDDLELLARVVDNAKKYYANPKEYDRAWSELEEEDESEKYNL